MSKKFPIYKQTEFQIVNTETVQDNFLEYAGEVNGQLDSANMPVRALDYDNFKSADTTTTTAADYTINEWVGETQQYKEIRRWNWEHGDPLGWDEQLMTIDLTSDDWNKGWNQLIDYDGWSSFSLDMDCWDGYINGCANIDYHHGGAMVTYQDADDNTFRALIGYDWECEWAVFLNGALIAESGPLVTYGHNIVIPFGTGVGTGPVKITIAWKATTTKDLALTHLNSTPSDPTTPLEMFGATIWARNTRR